MHLLFCFIIYVREKLDAFVSPIVPWVWRSTAPHSELSGLSCGHSEGRAPLPGGVFSDASAQLWVQQSRTRCHLSSYGSCYTAQGVTVGICLRLTRSCFSSFAAVGGGLKQVQVQLRVPLGSSPFRSLMLKPWWSDLRPIINSLLLMSDDRALIGTDFVAMCSVMCCQEMLTDAMRNNKCGAAIMERSSQAVWKLIARILAPMLPYAPVPLRV